MDFFVVHAFIESVKRRTITPMDVYDAAAWTAIKPLSESPIEMGNETVAFPWFHVRQLDASVKTISHLTNEY